jgi:hypothetical protein
MTMPTFFWRRTLAKTHVAHAFYDPEGTKCVCVSGHRTGPGAMGKTEPCEYPPNEPACEQCYAGIRRIQKNGSSDLASEYGGFDKNQRPHLWRMTDLLSHVFVFAMTWFDARAIAAIYFQLGPEKIEGCLVEGDGVAIAMGHRIVERDTKLGGVLALEADRDLSLLEARSGVGLVYTSEPERPRSRPSPRPRSRSKIRFGIYWVSDTENGWYKPDHVTIGLWSREAAQQYADGLNGPSPLALGSRHVSYFVVPYAEGSTPLLVWGIWIEGADLRGWMMQQTFVVKDLAVAERNKHQTYSDEAKLGETISVRIRDVVAPETCEFGGDACKNPSAYICENELPYDGWMHICESHKCEQCVPTPTWVPQNPRNQTPDRTP